MEMTNPPHPSYTFELKTLEKREETGGTKSSMKIGFPKEKSDDEYRMAATPDGVSVLSANGHEVSIESGAGEGAGFEDHEYSDAGASIIWEAGELYKKSDIIVKVAPPEEQEYALLQPGQSIFSALHLGNTTKNYLQELVKKKITGIGFEFIQTPENSFPIVRMMHEMTGSMSIQIAAHYLENKQQGKGVLLGGVSGVPPANVVILGAGVIAEYAARTALGYGAQVYVLDTDLAKLRQLENALGRRVITAMATQHYLFSALQNADVLIGAVMVEGHRAPCWATRPMVEKMKPGSVIIDAVIDQGGCIETSRPTTQANPVFLENGVIHYCVPNIPSNAAQTATAALNNLLTPFLLDIGDAGGVQKALWTNAALRNGAYVFNGQLTKKSLAQLFDMPWRDIEMLIASSL